jgi:triosephosphate isomerase
LRFELKPIVCLGEEDILSEREIYDFLHGQMDEILKNVSSKDISKVIFAYEPRWAIGKSLAAPVSHIKKVHAMIREVLGEGYGTMAARESCIIYGGSVNQSNASEIAVQDGVDGLFIGRIGLKATTFSNIIMNVARVLNTKE